MNTNTKASDIMSSNLKKIKGSDTINDAFKAMNNAKIHHLLVVNDKDQLIGVVSDRDIKKIMSPFIGSKFEKPQDKATLLVKIEGVMSKKVESCSSEATLKNCIELMLQKVIHSVPIINEEGKLVGIVTATDVLKKFLGYL